MMEYRIYPPVPMPGYADGIFRDERIKDPDLLIERARQELAARQVPEVSYQVEAVDLVAVSDPEAPSIALGQIVHVIDEDLNIAIQPIVRSVTRDVRQPGSLALELSNDYIDVAKHIATAVRKATEPEPPNRLPPQRVIMGDAPEGDPDNPPTLEDWQYDGNDDNEIDGAKIAHGTIQKLYFGEVLEDQTVDTTQKYKVAILSAVDKSDSGGYVSEAFVPDDEAAHYAVGDRVVVAVQAQKDHDDGWHAIIISAAARNAMWTFTWNEGEETP